MDTQLMRLSINSSSSRSNNDDVIINIREDSRRIGDEDSTLKELIKNDRNLVLFLLVLGFHINDERNSTTITILARTWQFILLLFGGIGFCWQTFIYGGHHVASLYEALTSSTSKSIGIFIEFGLALKMFIVPLAQVTSLMYGVSVIYKQIDQPVNVDIASPILASCKRTTLAFFIFIALLVIIINPYTMTRNIYKDEFVDKDDGNLSEYGEQSYPLFVFNRFTVNIFFSLSVTCYLSVVLLFKSFSMKLICTMQADAMKIINTDKFELDKYLAVKQKIISLKNGAYFSSQLLTFTAAINVITFIFVLWFNHYVFIKTTNGNSVDDDSSSAYAVDYSAMLTHDFIQLPYLSKGTITLYYYYHYHSYKYHY
jgi:hypothetical protein